MENYEMSKEKRNVKGWKYYNHAAIPTTAPHEEPNLDAVKNGEIWNINGKKPLFVRYCTNWDCEKETGWWYIIKESPFDIQEFSSKRRKHINQALKKCKVVLINPNEHLEELYEVYKSAFNRYENADNEKKFEEFKLNCLEEFNSGVEFWAGFTIEKSKLVGYMTIKKFNDYVESCTAKYHPDYLKYRISDAIHYAVLNEYLNIQKKRYMSSGSRNINHVTNAQEYKIESFNFRRAYCKLHIIYKPVVGLVIKILYPFRKIIRKYDRILILHQIAGVLKMEEIRRKDE